MKHSCPLFICIFLIACTPGAKEQGGKDVSDSTRIKTLQPTNADVEHIPTNATLENGLYHIRPTLGSAFEYNPSEEKKFQQLEALQKRVDKGELKFDNLSTEQQDQLDALSMDGGYWSIGISPVPQWSDLFPASKITATSTLPATKTVNYEVANLTDNDLRTVWSEGANGQGIGESITFEYPAKTQGGDVVLTSVSIINGFVKNNELWKKNSRVKTFKVYINDKPYAVLHLEDSKAFQTFDLGKVSSANGFILKFEISEVYPGDVYEDVVLSYMEFGGDGVLCFDASTVIRMADGTVKTIDQIRPGDEILSMNSLNHSMTSATVEQVGTAFHNNLVEIDLGGQKIIATADHPILTARHTWASVEPHAHGVGTMTAETKILTFNDGLIGVKKIKSIRHLLGQRITYAITKTSANQPYVANGMWVAVETPVLF